MSDPSELIPFRLRRAPSALDPHNNADAFDIRLLTRNAELSKAFKLRHRAYATQGYIPDISDSEYKDLHDDFPTTAIFGGFDNGRLVASMRLCFSFPNDALEALPCAPYYPALTGFKEHAVNGLAEVSRLCIEPDIGNTSYRATLYGFMVRSAFAAARAGNVSAIIVATRPDWVSYYKHLLSFEQVGEPAFYPPGGIPITLLAGHIDVASRRTQIRNRFFRVTDEEIARMQHMLIPVLKPQSAAVASGGE